MHKFTRFSTRQLVLACVLALGSASSVAGSAHLMPVYVSGVTGDADANEQALATLTAELKKQPTDLEIQAMLGAVETSGAKHAMMPWNKMKAAEQGLARLDKALRLLPTPDQHKPDAAVMALTMQVHTIAGCTFIHLPDMFKRFDQGYGLLKGQLQNPGFAYAPSAAKNAVYSCASQAAERAGDAAQANQWRQQLTHAN